MIALIQRVRHAQVVVSNQVVGQIQHGMLALIGIRPDDSLASADRLLQRLLGYRIFADEADKMNLSLSQIQAGLLLVPQFTLAADTKKGTRPSFTPAAHPNHAKPLFDYLFQQAQQQHALVAQGQFGADMQVSLCNDGPVTFWLES